MSESVETLHDMGLPAAMLHMLVPRSPALAQIQKQAEPKPHDVDRFTSDAATRASSPEPVADELRRVAELHQAKLASAASASADASSVGSLADESATASS